MALSNFFFYHWSKYNKMHNLTINACFNSLCQFFLSPLVCLDLYICLWITYFNNYYNIYLTIIPSNHILSIPIKCYLSFTGSIFSAIFIGICKNIAIKKWLFHFLNILTKKKQYLTNDQMQRQTSLHAEVNSQTRISRTRKTAAMVCLMIEQSCSYFHFLHWRISHVEVSLKLFIYALMTDAACRYCSRKDDYSRWQITNEKEKSKQMEKVWVV